MILDKLESRYAYTDCINCENVIEQMGQFDMSDNTMYLDCYNCSEEMVVWNWYDDWEDGE